MDTDAQYQLIVHGMFYPKTITTCMKDSYPKEKISKIKLNMFLQLVTYRKLIRKGLGFDFEQLLRIQVSKLGQVLASNQAALLDFFKKLHSLLVG